jgi:hypothetical protein
MKIVLPLALALLPLTLVVACEKKDEPAPVAEEATPAEPAPAAEEAAPTEAAPAEAKPAEPAK